MDTAQVRAPVSLLLDRELPASAKVIWLMGQLHQRTGEIQAATGLSRMTIIRGREQLSSRSWSDTPAVVLPQDFLEDSGVIPSGKVLYGILQLTPNYRPPTGLFTYERLSTLAGVCHHTLKRAVKNLADTGWLLVSQKSRVSPIIFTLTTPEDESQREEAHRAKRRIRRAKNTGERIMQEYLTLLADDQDYMDGGYASVLTNPFTGEPLQFDRYYKVGVAFEFNGPGHYEGEVALQKARDYLKHGMCRDAGIKLQVVHPRDLSLKGMRAKIGDLLPTHPIQSKHPVARALEAESRRYLATAGDWTGPTKA